MKKILGLGNALVDIMTKIDSDTVLENLNLPKGSMQLVDNKQVASVQNKTTQYNPSLASGGSAANTINGLANLYAPTGYIGKIGKDELGTFYKEDLEKNKIQPILSTGDQETGRAVALVSPDGERTFATYLGAAIELNASDIKPEMFDKFDYFHVEGYLVQNHELIEESLKMAKRAGLKVALDLASYNVVEDNLEFLTHLVQNYVDIVFANEEESKAFTAKEPRESLDEIAKMCEIAIVKIGKDGAFIKRGEEIVKVDAIKANVIDTTGAGDFYASGFLFGLANDLKLEQCGKMGSVLAGNVIEYIGANIPEEKWNEIRTTVKEISEE